MNKIILFSQEEKMRKIDKQDQIIIQFLNINSKIPIKEISRKIHKTKECVYTRIKSLEEKNIILGYPTIINFEQINIHRYLFKISLKGSIFEKEQYVQKLQENKDIISISETLNELFCLFFIKNESHLNQIIAQVIDDKVLNFQFSKIIRYNYAPPMLFDLDKDYAFLKYLYKPLKNVKDKKNIDELDFKILKILAINSNKKISEISKELKTQRDTIKYRINKLTSLNIIESYHIYFNIHTLGYMTHALQISVKNRIDQKKIIEYLKKHPLTNGVIEIDDKYNLLVPFYSKNIKEVINFEKDFLYKYTQDIFAHKILEFKEQMTIREFPEFI